MTRRAALLAFVLALGAARPARSAGGPVLEVRTIQGFRTDGGVSVDKQLADLPQLTKDEPFTRYNVYRLLDARQLPIASGQTVTHALVNGRTLQVTLASVVEENSQTRYRIEAQIGEPGKRAYLRSLHLTAGPNQPFFVGGQQYQGGTLFVEIAVRP